jgi:hypothetical protein
VRRRRPAWTVPPENLRLARQDLVRAARRAAVTMRECANLHYECGVVNLRQRDEVHGYVDDLVAGAHVQLHGRPGQVERLRRLSCGL